MYIYVIVQEPEEYYRHGPPGQVKARLEQASGERCLIVPYREFDLAVVDRLRPRAVIMSGFGGHFQSRDAAWFRGMDGVIRHADLPILCFCGGHQVLGFSFNRNLQRTRKLKDEPMRRLEPAEHFPRKAQGDPEYDLSG